MQWDLNPKLLREVAAAIFVMAGILFILSIFSMAGEVGLFFAQKFDYIFGIIGYILPFIILFVGVFLWNPSRFKIKPLPIIGIILALVFVPALINPYGGQFGHNVFTSFQSAMGTIGSYLVLAGLSLISVLVTINMSLAEVLEKIKGSEVAERDVRVHGNINAEPSKVSVFTTMRTKMGGFMNGSTPQHSVEAKAHASMPQRKDTGWENPPIELLELSNLKANPGNINKNVEIIQKTLKDFGVDVAMSDVNIGPTVTQYTLKPADGVKLNNIVARTNDLALSLAAHPIRMEAPIPGKSAVGIEVPNKVPAIVTLREVLETPEFKSATKNSSLCVALGRDVAGYPMVVDLKKMPHLLVAGATGSGKSICLHGLILNLLYQNSPAQLKFLMIDPKRVEFTHYNEVPHMLIPAITESDQAISGLRWAIFEMERRFQLFQEARKRDIESFNQSSQDKLPYIVIVIDELADLMVQAANEVETAIVRLAQMARATGIHLIVATQRPSVDVITGLIKANITTRIAFAVASQVDSRTIIDMSGAEKLLGKGDMLYLSSDFGKPRRVQGSMVTEKETKSVTDWFKERGIPQYDEQIYNFYKNRNVVGSGGEVDDDLFDEAKKIVIQAGKGSASLLQRRLRVGYARAARLLDLLEMEGVIGPADGAKPRDILVDSYEPNPFSHPSGNNANYSQTSINRTNNSNGLQDEYQ